MEFVDSEEKDTNENHCTSCPAMTLDSKDVEAPAEKMENSGTTIETPPKDPEPDKITEIGGDTREKIDFKVIFNKKKIDVNFPLDGTIGELKEYLQEVISVPKDMQKVMIKGLAKDEQTLRELGVTNGAKLMIVGSKLDDVLQVATVPTKQEIQDEAAAASSKEPLTQQKIHKKILDKGVPEDAMPGILEAKDPLPDFPLSGMLNKMGGKVRLTFKLEQDQLWIGTKERTDKIPMNSIKGIHSESIPEHPQYHIMAIQLGPTEASRYWIYWVPAQYIAAIKDAILGKWCYF